jgi:hypothetical protein
LDCPELIAEFERKRKERIANKEKEVKPTKRKAGPESSKEKDRDVSPPPAREPKKEAKKPRRVWVFL